MKVSMGQSQPEICCRRLLNSLHGSGKTILIPGVDCGSSTVQEAVGAAGTFSLLRGVRGLRGPSFFVFKADDCILDAARALGQTLGTPQGTGKHGGCPPHLPEARPLNHGNCGKPRVSRFPGALGHPQFMVVVGKHFTFLLIVV